MRSDPAADLSCGIVERLLCMPEPQECSFDKVKVVLTIPWALHESEAPGVVQHKSTTQAVVAQSKPAQVRCLYIMPEDFETNGYTKNCRECQHILAHGPNTGTMPHTEQCRARITAALSKTPAGRARIQKMMEKGDRFIASHIQKQDEEAAPAPEGEEASSSNAPSVAPPFSECAFSYPQLNLWGDEAADIQ